MPIETTIRQLRQARGLTQEQVARALGVSAPAVSKWETGASLPEITLLPALARLLGTDLNELLSFQKEMSREDVAAFLNQLQRRRRQRECRQPLPRPGPSTGSFPAAACWP